MLYVDGKSKLAKLLANLQASSYTEKETAHSAQVISDKGVAHAVNEHPPDQGGALGSSIHREYSGELSNGPPPKNLPQSSCVTFTCISQ